MDKVLLKAEADKRWWNIMCICSIIILFIGAFLLFSALTEESKPYLSYYQDTKRSQDIIIFIIILLGGLFSLYTNANYASMSICICKNKVYVSTGMKQSDKYEFLYSEILDVNKKGNYINIQTVNTRLSLFRIEHSDKVIKLLQDNIKINKEE